MRTSVIFTTGESGDTWIIQGDRISQYIFFINRTGTKEIQWECFIRHKNSKHDD